MVLTLWILMVTAAVAGGGLAAMTTVPSRRTTGLLTATAAVAGLLVILGLDLPAVVWLGAGGGAALLSVPAGHQPDRALHVTGVHPRRTSLLFAGVAVGLLFAILYRVALQVDWRQLPPGPETGQTSLVGGHLLVTDVALAATAAIVLAVAMAAASRRRGSSDGTGGAS